MLVHRNQQLERSQEPEAAQRGWNSKTCPKPLGGIALWAHVVELTKVKQTSGKYHVTNK